MRQIRDNKTLPGCGFHHIAFRTSDWDASLRFWRDGLGFTPAIEWGEAPRRATMLDVGDGNYLELFEREAAEQTDGTEREGSALHFALRVESCDAATARAIEFGAIVTMEPKSLDIKGDITAPVRISFVRAPDGTVVEFFENNVL
jgi:glyoxylase I family protein